MNITTVKNKIFGVHLFFSKLQYKIANLYVTTITLAFNLNSSNSFEVMPKLYLVPFRHKIKLNSITANIIVFPIKTKTWLDEENRICIQFLVSLRTILAVTNIRQNVAHTTTNQTQKLCRKGDLCLLITSLPNTGSRWRRLKYTRKAGMMY